MLTYQETVASIHKGNLIKTSSFPAGGALTCNYDFLFWFTSLFSHLTLKCSYQINLINQCILLKKKKTKNILSVVQAIAEHTGVFSHALGGEVYGMHTGQELRN